MKYLLDTHILLWMAGNPEKLSVKAQRLMKSSDSKLFFSIVNLWEMVIKRALNRADFQVDVHVLRRELLNNGYNELLIESRHAFMIGHLPPIHKDPFDRMLIAQAMTEGLVLLTADPVVVQYPGPIEAM